MIFHASLPARLEPNPYFYALFVFIFTNCVLEMFKKLKSLFVIEEGEPAQEAKGAETTETHRKENIPQRTAPVSQTGQTTGHVQNKFLEVLFGALESNNQEGFDYLEFKDFLKSLANVPMEDSIRFKSAFATAQTMGATKEKILSSARAYMDVLTK